MVIKRVAICHIAVAPQLAHAVSVCPTIERVAHDVAKNEAVVDVVPDGAFEEVKARGELFYLNIGVENVVKAWVADV